MDIYDGLQIDRALLLTFSEQEKEIWFGRLEGLDKK